MADLPSDQSDGRRVITEGFFQREVDLSREPQTPDQRLATLWSEGRKET